MKLFFDTEFTGLHRYTTLISIGIVTENNKRFYAEFNDYDKCQVNDWLENNVIKKLYLAKTLLRPGEQDVEATIQYNQKDHLVEVLGSQKDIKDALVEWLSDIGASQYEMWSDCLAYDWVLFCQLFGGALSVPKNIYYTPFDICTLMKMKGVDPDINREDFIGNVAWMNGEEEKHNALWDALVIKACYEKLMTL